MAWEVEETHVDLDQMTHVTIFVEKSVKTINGEPAKFHLIFPLGGGSNLTSEAFKFHHLKLREDGTLVHSDDQEVDMRAVKERVLAELNGLHAAGRAHAKKHNVKLYGGPRR